MTDALAKDDGVIFDLLGGGGDFSKDSLFLNHPVFLPMSTWLPRKSIRSSIREESKAPDEQTGNVKYWWHADKVMEIAILLLPLLF